MTDNDYFEYYNFIASSKEKELMDKYGDLSILFNDMIFQPNTSTYDFIAIKFKSLDSDDWYNDALNIPDELQYPPNVKICIRELSEGISGQFNHESSTITISPVYQDDDSVLLHEMLHSFEHNLENHMPYFRDAIFICLYRNIKNQIPNIDDLILEHGHIYTQHNFVMNNSGVHDILFFLKSLDLDLQKGYPLGTVFGYDYESNMNTPT